ncbi:hypothetical protein JCM10213_003446 [Rhodosporidiobolus nylandii]
MSSSSDDCEKLKAPLLRRSHRARRPASPTSVFTSFNPFTFAIAVVCALFLSRYSDALRGRSGGSWAHTVSVRAVGEISALRWSEAVERCEDLHVLPGVPDSFWRRKESDRFVPGTRPTLIRNATVWTGEDDGKEVLHNHDVLLDRGLIIDVGENLQREAFADVIDAHGAWLTPGIVDMHSHVGVDSLPSLSGADDTNSRAGAVLPHLRSLDGINGHDLAYRRIAAGGITTTLVLPGSANNVGGQAFVIKLRPTAERTIDSRVVEMPWNVARPGGEKKKRGDPPRVRHMKMACGENIRRVYSQTRLDLAWNWRSAFDSARSLKLKQDAYCSRALDAHRAGKVLVSSTGEVESFPDDLKQEALVDVLRGKVRVNTHCYETTDLNAFIRHTHEFQFPVAAFHHAHEAYLVPELLKEAWPGNGSSTPAIALFGTNGKYKREAWRDSEYAGKVLHEANISVVYKSDHPVTDSRYLPFQAQQGHNFGLPAHVALSAITTTPARVAGLSHRVGFVRVNHDGDIVLWKAHPLSLGATPQQVFIDGIKQLVEPHPPALATEGTRKNGPPSASLPANYDPTREQEDDGFDFLNPGEKEHKKATEIVRKVKFTNVGEVLLPGSRRVAAQGEAYEIVVEGDELVCAKRSCSSSSGVKEIDLKGGSLLPPLVGYGTALGLAEIVSEKSSLDGTVFDPLFSSSLSGTQQHFASSVAVKAVDGLAFGGKHLKVAEGAGVTKAVAVPQGDGFFLGVSAAFRTSAAHALEDGAIIKEATALHIQIGHNGKTPSISTQIAYLRSLLLASSSSSSFSSATDNEDYFTLAARGKLPLVIHTEKADIIATLIKLKAETEEKTGREGRWVIHGASEAHLLASELAHARIGVILTRPRSMPESWDERRGLPGPPLTREGPVEVLHAAGVKVALGSLEEHEHRALIWEAAWAQRISDGRVSREDAVEMVTSNLEELLGFDDEGRDGEWVAFERDPFEFGSRMVAASTVDGKVKLFL